MTMALLVSPLTMADGKVGEIPSFKWSQDQETLYLTIEVECNQETVDVVANEDFFGFSCTATNGKKKTLSFTPREDIVSGSVSCKSKNKFETCSIKKKHRHNFDRLWVREDDERMKKKAKVDWKALSDDESELSLPYSTKHIKILDEAKLDEMIEKAKKDSTGVVLDVSFPWCGKCQSSRDTFERLAKKLNKIAKFGYVDAREYRPLARRFEADCTHKCEFHVLSPGEDTFAKFEIKEKSKSGTVGKELTNYLKPLIIKIQTPDQIKTLADRFGTVIVTTKTGKDFLNSYKNAALLARDITFTTMEDSQNTDRLWAAVKRSSTSILFPGNEFSSYSIVQFAKRVAIPSYVKADLDKREELMAAGIPIARLYVRDFDAEMKPIKTNKTLAKIMKKISSGYRSQITTLVCGRNFQMDMEDAGLSMDELPALAIFEDYEGKGKKYAYLKDDFSETSLRAFYEDYFDGKLEPTYKSKPIPNVEYGPGEVVEVVQRSFDQYILNPEKKLGDVVVMLYKLWSEKIEKHNSTLNTLAKVLKDVDITVTRINAFDNYINEEQFQIRGGYWSDVRLYLFSDSVENRAPIMLANEAIVIPDDENDPHHDNPEAEDPFTLSRVLKQLKTYLPSVAEKWDDIKGHIKDMNKDIAERAERKRKETEEKKKAQEEEAAKLEEKLETIEMEDIHENGGVMKQVLREGNGEIPESGARITAHYTGTLLDGTKFDSSRDRGEPFVFTLGQGVISCWSDAFATMSVGERAMLTCKPEYAYGKSGSPPTIPPNATLKFDVELLSFESA